MLEPIPKKTLLDYRKILLLAIAGLTVLFFIEEFFLHEKLPTQEWEGVTINWRGLYFVGSIYLVFYLTFKKILQQDPLISVFYLIAFASLIVLFSELIFQSYLVAKAQYNDEQLFPSHIMFFLANLLIQPLISLAFSVPMAVELRHKNRVLGYVLFLVLGGLFWYLFVYLRLLQGTIF